MTRDRVSVGPAFQVVDANARRYKVTRYEWLEFSGDRWVPCWSVLMTENGGIVEPLGPDDYEVEGTKNRVKRI
jgi:hypothetical protein